MSEAQPFYLLQPVQTDADAARTVLYARLPEDCRCGNAGLVLGRGAALDLDTFFASFYEAYWRRHTDIADIAFAVRLTGRAQVRLFRQDDGGTVLQIAEKECAGSATTHLLAVPEGVRAGRLFAQIEALEDETVLAGMGWGTPTAPRRTVVLTVVICTFERERELTAILDELAPLCGGIVAGIIIVNHGAPGLAQRLPAAPGRNLIVCDQENSGGSGGFARGLREAVARSSASHAVLLDDDIAIDGGILARLPVLLAHGRDKLVVGGYMMDVMRPRFLHNNVTRMDFTRLKVTAPLPPCDLGETAALAQLARIETADFCGWWCCALPLAAVREIGGPLPFFLHYDDAEYGLRLRAAGYESVSWPGLAVWHEPFYLKQQRWRRYYDFRNALFLTRLHGPLNRAAALRQFGWRFAVNLVQFHYDSAAAILLAMADYLEGPRLLAAWDAAAHRAMMEALAGWAGAETEGPPPVADMYGLCRALRRDPHKVLRLAARFVWLAAAFLCGRDYLWRRRTLRALAALRPSR